MDQLIRTTSFGLTNKMLKLDGDVLTFGQKSIALRAVTGLRYGLAPIQFDMFYIGRRYLIELRTPDGQLKINLSSYFGVGRKYFERSYGEVLNAIWDMTAVRIMQEAVQKVKAGEVINVGKCSIHIDGVSVKGELLPWHDVSYVKSYDKLTLNSRSDPRIFTNLYYLQEYNVDMVMFLLDRVVKDKWSFDDLTSDIK